MRLGCWPLKIEHTKEFNLILAVAKVHPAEVRFTAIKVEFMNYSKRLRVFAMLNGELQHFRKDSMPPHNDKKPQVEPGFSHDQWNLLS